MALRQTIEQDVIQAMKDKNESLVLVLRAAKTAIMNAEIAKRPEALTEDDIMKVLRSEVKRRKDAVALYQQGGRPELAEHEQAEIVVLEKYLPAQVDEATIRTIVEQVLSEQPTATMADIGRLTGAVMGKLKGQSVDGAVVNAVIKQTLTSRAAA